MTRTRYRIYETEYPYFMTSTINGWLPVFTRQEAADIHNNPVVRGFVDDPLHWRWSSARNYAGQSGLIEVVTDWR